MLAISKLFVVEVSKSNGYDTSAFAPLNVPCSNGDAVPTWRGFCQRSILPHAPRFPRQLRAVSTRLSCQGYAGPRASTRSADLLMRIDRRLAGSPQATALARLHSSAPTGTRFLLIAPSTRQPARDLPPLTQRRTHDMWGWRRRTLPSSRSGARRMRCPMPRSASCSPCLQADPAKGVSRRQTLPALDS